MRCLFGPSDAVLDPGVLSVEVFEVVLYVSTMHSDIVYFLF